MRIVGTPDFETMEQDIDNIKEKLESLPCLHDFTFYVDGGLQETENNVTDNVKRICDDLSAEICEEIEERTKDYVDATDFEEKHDELVAKIDNLHELMEGMKELKKEAPLRYTMTFIEQIVNGTTQISNVELDTKEQADFFFSYFHCHHDTHCVALGPDEDLFKLREIFTYFTGGHQGIQKQEVIVRHMKGLGLRRDLFKGQRQSLFSEIRRSSSPFVFPFPSYHVSVVFSWTILDLS